MSNDLDQYCRDYLNDALSGAERKRFEQRLAGGDKDLIEALNRQKSFKSSMQGSDSDSRKQSGSQASLFEEDSSDLLNFVTGSSTTSSPSSSSSKKESPPKGDSISAERSPSSPDPKPSTAKKRAPKADNNPSESASETTDNVFDSVRERTAVTERRWVKIILSLLFVGLAVLLIYSSWQNYLLENKVNILQERQRLADVEISQMEENLRAVNFQNRRILDIMRSDFTTLNIITTEHEKLKRWVQLWDKGTLRTAVVLQEPNLSAEEELQLWSYNLRDRVWQQAGTIDHATNDSIYTQWSSSDLARSYRLRVILFNKADSTEQVLGSQRVR